MDGWKSSFSLAIESERDIPGFQSVRRAGAVAARCRRVSTILRATMHPEDTSQTIKTPNREKSPRYIMNETMRRPPSAVQIRARNPPVVVLTANKIEARSASREAFPMEKQLCVRARVPK